MADYQRKEDQVLTSLCTDFAALAQCAEKVNLDAAPAELKVAQANVKDIEISASAMQVAETGSDGVLEAGAWLASHTVNILNTKSVAVNGDLRVLCKEGSRLNAHAVEAFAERVEFSVEFLPRKRVDFFEGVFGKLMGDLKIEKGRAAP
jgi:hypothetical protein